MTANLRAPLTVQLEPLLLDELVPVVPQNEIPRPSSTTSLKKAAKQKVYKIRDRTVITKTQKRSRWIPGKRYMPLFWLKSLFHPFAVLWRHYKAKFLNHDNRHHHVHHVHHVHHHSSDPVDDQMKIVSGERDLLIE